MAIAVHGATGRVGRAAVAELVRLGEEPVPLDMRDDAFVSSLRRCSVMLNCAGPYWKIGEPAVRAAIEAGVHYCDAAGEQPFIRSVFERHGAQAERRGVALVPALGFDYALGDCLARLAASGHEPLRELVIAYALSGSGTSADAAQSAGEVPHGDEVAYREGAWGPVRPGVHRASFRFPAPLGRQPMERYGAGEVVTVPRHTRTRAVTTLITASTWAPDPRLVPLMPYLRPLAALALRTPARRLLAARAQAGDDAGEDAQFTIAAVAHGEDGSVGRALARGGDFYALTARSLAVGARRLADSGFSGRGALGPAAAFDPASFLDELGVEWEGS